MSAGPRHRCKLSGTDDDLLGWHELRMDLVQDLRISPSQRFWRKDASGEGHPKGVPTGP